LDDGNDLSLNPLQLPIFLTSMDHHVPSAETSTRGCKVKLDAKQKGRLAHLFDFGFPVPQSDYGCPTLSRFLESVGDTNLKSLSF
jgi:hypothetical protein